MLEHITYYGSKRIYEDCVKEENETVQQCENFGKYVGNLSMN